jgi:hypothetical protein
LYNSQFPIKDSTDFFKIQYNLANPTEDIINLESPYAPAARSLYYGISQPPAAIMDGIIGDYFTATFNGNYNLIRITDIERRSLESPVFDIQLNELPVSPDSLKLDVTLTYIDSTSLTYNSPVALQVGLVDGDVLTNVNVLRKFLLGSEALKIDMDWSLDQSLTIPTINAAIDVPVRNGNSLYLIAFVQDSSKRILQAIKQKAANNKSQQQVVGVDDPLTTAINRLHFYPNPATGQLNMVSDQPLPEGVAYTIIDQRGIQLLKGDVKTDITSPQQIDVRGLANGIYIISISRGGKPLLHRKIAVMN